VRQAATCPQSLRAAPHYVPVVDVVLAETASDQLEEAAQGEATVARGRAFNADQTRLLGVRELAWYSTGSGEISGMK